MTLPMCLFKNSSRPETFKPAGVRPGTALVGALAAVALWALLFVWPLLHADGDGLSAQPQVAEPVLSTPQLDLSLPLEAISLTL